MTDSLDRRTLLLGMSASGALVLAACGGGSGSGPAAGQPLARLDDIPVGGALSVKSADGKPVILSRPAGETVVGLSAVCTHQGCTVEVSDKVLACPCHGSRYEAATGMVLNGPAPSPLAAFPVRVENGSVLSA